MNPIQVPEMQSYAAAREKGGTQLAQTHLCPSSLREDQLGAAHK